VAIGLTSILARWGPWWSGGLLQSQNGSDKGDLKIKRLYRQGFILHRNMVIDILRVLILSIKIVHCNTIILAPAAQDDFLFSLTFG
jgi:hypothetical protein